MNKFNNWCSNLKNYWQEKNIEEILNLFSEEVEYYEDPHTKLTSFEEVQQVWEEIKNQNTINIEYKILCTENNKCIVNFILIDNPTYDMIYELILDDNNKCTYFKQWFMEM